ncbi:MAG: Hsp20/alpha crystallin family protein [Magnetococcales bacterium]|nr:Hsp20/alpha crystallin family protein [Magnetococcales bacterium]
MNLPLKVQPPENLEKTKKWTIFLFLILILVIGVQSFFISSLSGEVDALNLETATVRAHLAQPIDSPSISQKSLTTNNVTTISTDTPDKSINYTMHAHPSVVSRLIADDPPIIEPRTETNPDPITPPTTLQNDLWQGFSHDPFVRMEQMQKKMDELMQRSGMPNGFANFPKSFDNFGFSSVSGFEVQEEGDKYIVTGKISGVKESNINITIEGRRLSIKSVSKKENLTEDDQMGKGMFSRHSMFSSHFEKHITLPGDVDEAGMEVKFDKDQITISIPKKAEGLLY